MGLLQVWFGQSDTRLDGARHVAVKRMKHHDLSAQYLRYFEDEVPRLVALNHPNLLPLMGVCLQDFIFTLFEWHVRRSPRLT